MILVYELDVGEIGLIKDYSHDCLTCSDWTVYFCVDFVDAHGVTFADECVKDVFTKLFTLDDDFFWDWMDLGIEAG